MSSLHRNSAVSSSMSTCTECASNPSSSAAATRRSTMACARLIRSSCLPQDARHLLAARELVHELVEVPDLLHERILDLLHPHPADHPGDELDVGVEPGIREEIGEGGSVGQVTGEVCVVEARQPV